MEVIKATPSNITELFGKQYIIPEYQRPYTWSTDKCHILWDDILGAYTDSKKEYFLGTTVLIKDESNSNKQLIIDGQQRITSLLLLMKSLTNHHEYTLLNRCIYIYNPKNDERLSSHELRIESCVLDTDKENLIHILYGDSSKSSGHFKENYEYLNKLVEEWKLKNPDQIEFLIEYILNEVKLLPIDCGEEEQALKVFETLNDRGTPLNETDIFKSKLYRNLKTDVEKQSFITFWNELEDPILFFRIYMHINRAKLNDIGNELNLRTYFSKMISNDSQTQQILKDLKKIQLCYQFTHPLIDYWKSTSLELYPSDTVIAYIYYIYMFKYAEINFSGELMLSNDHTIHLVELLKNLLRFIYTRGVIYKTRNAIKYEIFKACVEIYHDSNINTNPFPAISSDEKTKLENALSSLTSRDRYTKGILGLYHSLNPNQEHSYTNFSNHHIEHILPRAWQHYDGWTEEEYTKYINCLGNLTLLDRKLNIKAKNEYLSKKQEYYKKSSIKDVHTDLDSTSFVLSKLQDWSAKQCLSRQEEIINRITSFLVQQ